MTSLFLFLCPSLRTLNRIHGPIVTRDFVMSMGVTDPTALKFPLTWKTSKSYGPETSLRDEKDTRPWLWRLRGVPYPKPSLRLSRSFFAGASFERRLETRISFSFPSMASPSTATLMTPDSPVPRKHKSRIPKSRREVFKSFDNLVSLANDQERWRIADVTRVGRSLVYRDVGEPPVLLESVRECAEHAGAGAIRAFFIPFEEGGLG